MTAPTSISADELMDLLRTERPPTVIDVLTSEAFGETHIDRAENFCVYETAFVPKVAERFGDRETPLVTYGASGATREAQVAAEKLAAAGFTNIQWLDGGLDAWSRAGGKVIVGDAPPAASDTGSLMIDPASSVVLWTGRNLFNHHTGTMRLASGSIEVRDGKFVSGRIVIDMNSIACTDIQDPKLNQMLVDHLRDEDFFAVGRFPTAEFTFERIEPLADSRPGIPNFHVSGELLLRGVKRSIDFPAAIARKHDGTYTAQALFKIDRTDWGVLYGSSKFFAKLSEHVVSDHIQLHLKVSAHA